MLWSLGLCKSGRFAWKAYLRTLFIAPPPSGEEGPRRGQGPRPLFLTSRNIRRLDARQVGPGDHPFSADPGGWRQLRSKGRGTCQGSTPTAPWPDASARTVRCAAEVLIGGLDGRPEG